MCTRLLSKIKNTCTCGRPEEKFRVLGEGFAAGGAVVLALSTVAWFLAGKGDESGARRQRGAIYLGIWAPSLMVVAAYFVRKADEAELARQEDRVFLPEEFM